MQNQIPLLKNDVINGFSYSFLKILLNQFTEKKTNLVELFEFHPNSNFKGLSPLAKNLIYYLKQQAPYAGWGEIEITAEYADYKNSPHNNKSIDKILGNLLEKISIAEWETAKFLEIFE